MTDTPWAYRYRARLARVIDADTALLSVDMGLRITHELVVRLRGCNAAERATPAGHAAAMFAADWFTRNADKDGWVAVVTAKAPGDRYGRWLADITDVAGGRDLTTDLIAAGHAAAWDGAGSKPVPQPAA